MPIRDRRFIADFPAREAAPAPEPQPTAGETFLASFKAVRADTTGVIQEYQVDAYREIINELVELQPGTNFTKYVNYSTGTVNPEAVWRDVARFRQQGKGGGGLGLDTFWPDPNGLRKGLFERLPETVEEFEQQWRAAKAQEIAQAEGVAYRGPAYANFAGGVAGAMSDPVNIYTLPFGAVGKTAMRRMFSQGLTQALIQTSQLPTVQRNREELDRRDLSLTEGSFFVGGAFVGGAAFQGVFEGLRVTVPPAFERAVAANWDRLPQGLRDRWTARSRIVGSPQEDILLADMVEHLGGDNLTQLARDAIVVARREAQEEISGPFKPDGAGADMNRLSMEEVFGRVMAEAPLPAVAVERLPAAGRFAAAVPDRGPRRQFDWDSDPVRSAAFGEPLRSPVESFMARTRVQESGGRDDARNPRSTATGRYQFVDGTWLAYYKRRYGTGGLTDAQILAKRGDGRLQDILMRDLTEDNARFLRDRGEAVTDGNLYLVHFAGQGGARKVLDAAPGTPASQLFTAKALAANPFLKKMTAEDVVAWAHRAMDQRVPPRGSRPEVDVALARTQSELDAAQDALDAAITRAFTAVQKQREIAAGRDVEDVLPEAVFVDDVDMLPLSRLARAEPEPPATAAAAPLARTDTAVPADPDPDLAPILPVLDRLVSDGSPKINRAAELAEELGIPEPEVQRGLQMLVEQGRLVRDRQSGLLVRRPDDPVYSENANQLLGQVRTIAQDTKANLNDIPALARRLGAEPRDVEQALDRLVGLGELSRAKKPGIGPDGNPKRMATGKYLRPRPKGARAPDDLIGMLASMGGINPRGSRAPDGISGDGLGRVRGGHDLRNTGSLNHFVPGVGPLLRPNGMYLDEVGEWLVSRGVFRERPTESEVIDFLDRAIADGRKLDPETGQPIEPGGRVVGDEQDRIDVENWIDGELRDLGFAEPLDGDSMRELVDAIMSRPAGLTDDDMLYYGLNVMAERNQREAFDSNLEPVYEAIDYDQIISEGFPAGREAPPAEDDLGRWEPVPFYETPREGGSGRDGPFGGEARPEPDGRALADLAPEERSPFLDPDGPAIKQQTDSLEHDARAKHDAAMKAWLAQNEAERAARVEQELFMERGDKDLKYMGPVLYRETSVENLFPYIPETGVTIGRGPAGAEHYAATTPELALGQGNNRGVMIEFDTANLRGRIDLSKPAAKLLAETERKAEVIVSAQDHALGRNIRTFTIRPDAEITKVHRFRFDRMMRDLEAKGWGRTEGPDGITMTRPDLVEPVAAAPARNANASDAGLAAAMEMGREAAAGGAQRVPPGFLFSADHKAAWLAGFDGDDAGGAPIITTDTTGQADFAAPTGAQVRTALERKTEGGIRPTGEQKAPGSDGGLFDTRDTTGDMLNEAGDLFEGPRVQLDTDGPARPLRDVIDEFDREAQELKNIRDCL